ncbi:serine-rich adhesin for platelets [Bactrocera oleae]|uniref:serine-rich adhesin for platelets n=1 Tax=Bactrocera oleae TaxID=104688 RepID=UPI00387EE0F6
MQAAPPNAATKPKTASITTTNKPTIITHPVKTKPYIDSHLYQSTLQQQQQTVGSQIGSGKTSVVLSDDPTREIEEISKKISEHADALYHTWKSRGLAPTELLGFYTHAAAAAATSDGASDAGDLFAVDDEQTAEGLQKLVNTFVLKDKEQRAGKTNTNTSSAVNRLGSGVVSAGVIGIGGVGGLVGVGSVESGVILNTAQEPNIDANMVGKLKQSTASTTKRSVTSPKSPTTTSAILLKNVDTPGVDVVDTLKKKPTKSNGKTTGATSSSAATSSLTNKSALALKHEKQQHTTSTGSSAATSTKLRGTSSATNPTANTTTIGRSKPHVSNSAPLDINLTVDLNLDLADLSELQTHNLRKIKELLQENAPTTTTQIAKTATNSGTKQSRKANTTNTTATTGADAEAARHNANHHSRRGELTPKSNNIGSGGGGKGEVIAVNNGGGGSVNKAAITIVGNCGVADVVGVIATESVNADKNSGASGAGASNSGGKGGATITTVTNGKRSTVAAKVSNSKSTPADNQSNQSAISVSGHKQSSKESGEKSTTTTTSATPSTRIATVSSSGNKSIKAPTIKEDNKNDSNNNTNTHTNHLSSGASQHRTGSKSSAKKDTRTANSNGTGATTTGSTIGGATSENGMAAMPAATSGASTTTPSKFAKTGRTLINGQDKYVGRPILTRGSVAERVLMFEKCPDVRNSFLNIKRPDPADAPPKSLLKVKLHSTPPPPPEHNSIQREIRNTKTAYIPRFYFPHGKPQPQIALERTLRGILGAFDSFPNNQVTKDELPRILKICGLPFYWRMPVMVFCQQGNSGLVERQRFVEFWKQMNVYCHDAASRFVYILSRGQRFRQYILPEDLAPLVQDVVDTHPGLAFLKEATEFHSRYVHTVIARIFYSVNRCWSGRINISELKKSDLLEVLTLLEEEDDINQIMAFFSYEHFYVIYCKFWELDKDHDLLINQDDLARHSDHALSTRIVERIFSGCVTRGDNKKQPEDEPKMSYTDFVWFLLSEEDKRTPTAIEYWFRCMDIDGDGVLSMYELEYFYEEQQQRMESIGIETLPFEDCLCQMLDMIKPARRDCVSLGDLKRCKMTHVFFDTFFNLEKYLDHEQRDPFASQRDEYSSDWDRFAAQEYELLISEENE